MACRDDGECTCERMNGNDEEMAEIFVREQEIKE
jgi:hypothetical protein